MAKVFAGMLLQLRQESGISQRDAATSLGISQSLLSHYEKGSREPRLDFLVRAAAFYHVSTDYLLGCSAERTAPDTRSDDLSEKHRNLMDAMQFVLCRLEAEADPVFTDAAGHFLMLALYKVCRYLCIAIPESAPLFTADSMNFSEHADMAMKREELTMKRWGLRHADHASKLAVSWNIEPFKNQSHAVLALLHRSEHLMGDCLPLS